MLLKNHYIECVELFYLFNGDSHKDIIKQFLESILPSSTYYPKVKTSWNSINNYISHIQNSKEDWDITKISGEIKFVYSSSDKNRIPLQFSSEHHIRDHILRVLHSRFRGKWNIATEDEAMLAFSALREELLLPGHYFEEEEYKQLIGNCNGSLLSNIQSLSYKEQALANQNFSGSDAEVDNHIQIWKCLYNFDFKIAKKTD